MCVARTGRGPLLARLFFFSSRRRHTRLQGDWSSDVCSSDLASLHAHQHYGVPIVVPLRNLMADAGEDAMDGGGIQDDGFFRHGESGCREWNYQYRQGM